MAASRCLSSGVISLLGASLFFFLGDAPFVGEALPDFCEAAAASVWSACGLAQADALSLRVGDCSRSCTMRTLPLTAGASFLEPARASSLSFTISLVRRLTAACSLLLSDMASAQRLATTSALYFALNSLSTCWHQDDEVCPLGETVPLVFEAVLKTTVISENGHGPRSFTRFILYN